jgi:hypothetical protein
MSRNLRLLHSAESVSGEYRSSHRPFSRSDGLDTHNARRAVVDDEVMKLVQSVFILPQSAKRPDAVAFCGVGPGVGCSWVCANQRSIGDANRCECVRGGCKSAFPFAARIL